MGKLSMELYLKNLSKRYKAAKRAEKGEILKDVNGCIKALKYGAGYC